ncbi:MAG: SUMF1/EgtB/PvdO family nonheme iron enzyme [Candidatus Eisenbacteria bacterium]
MSRLIPAGQGAVLPLAACLGPVAALALAAHSALASPLIRVPAGSFLMGESTALCGDDERPVTLTRDFELSTTEVTNAEYLAALEWARAQGRVLLSGARVLDVASGQTLLELGSWYAEIQFDGAHFFLRQSPYALASAYPGGYDPATHPVVKVSWYGAAAFCNWRSELDGLPPAYDPVTFVCNGGDPYGARGDGRGWELRRSTLERTHRPGEAAADCALANRPAAATVGWTSPMGSHPEGASALGFVDMGGNVGEWTNDWWSCERGTAR